MHICYLCNVIFCVSKKLCALCKLRCVNCPCSLCNVHCSVQCVQCSVFSVQCSVFSVHLCYLHPAAPHVRHSPVTPGAANDPAEAFAGEPRWPPHPRFVHFFNLCRPISGPAQICLKSNQNWFSAPWHGLTWPTWHMADDQTAPQHMATKSAQPCPGICFFCLPGPMPMHQTKTFLDDVFSIFRHLILANDDEGRGKGGFVTRWDKAGQRWTFAICFNQPHPHLPTGLRKCGWQDTMFYWQEIE